MRHATVRGRASIALRAEIPSNWQARWQWTCTKPPVQSAALFQIGSRSRLAKTRARRLLKSGGSMRRARRGPMTCRRFAKSSASGRPPRPSSQPKNSPRLITIGSARPPCDRTFLCWMMARRCGFAVGILKLFREASQTCLTRGRIIASRTP
jgi:hypothetical protein